MKTFKLPGSAAALALVSLSLFSCGKSGSNVKDTTTQAAAQVSATSGFWQSDCIVQGSAPYTSNVRYLIKLDTTAGKAVREIRSYNPSDNSCAGPYNSNTYNYVINREGFLSDGTDVYWFVLTNGNSGAESRWGFKYLGNTMQGTQYQAVPNSSTKISATLTYHT